MANAVTSKGQVTIPKPVRELLGIRPGTEVSFVVAADGAVHLELARPTRRRSRFARLRGAAGAGASTEDILALTRGE
jgi:antitoxin PrlF